MGRKNLKYIMPAARISILILTSLLVTAWNAYTKGADTLRVYFATGLANLNNSQRAYLDSVIYRFKSNGISIIGYADEPGTTVLNRSLGQKRAQTVMSYLLSSGIGKEAIVQCIGRGNLLKTGEDAFQRRVDIVFTSGRSLTPAGIADEIPTQADSGLNMLPTMKHGEVLVLEGLQFAVSTSEFLPESYPILKKLVAVLSAHPNIKIRIEGHICCGPDPKSSQAKEYFFELSVDRAKHVHDYLVGNHIAPDRLSYEGFGFSKPRIYPEKTERDRFRNRRVELKVLSN
jgi:outer membrane protein OmpA-like peptidoglycan-associated protein